MVLVLLSWILSSQSSATAGQAMMGVDSLPTAPDFYIQDWPPPMASNEMRADIAHNPDANEYLVVFDWDFYGGGDHDVMFIVVYPDGNPAPMPIAVAEGTDFDDTNPAVAYNPDEGSYLAVWQRRIGTSSYQIFGALITETAGIPFPIYTGNADHLHPDVAYAPGLQRYLVVWEDHGAGWQPPPDIMGASLDGLGGDAQYIHIAPDLATDNHEQTRPAVAANGSNGRWIVTWQDSRHAATTGDDIFGLQVEYSGGGLTLWGSQFPIGAFAGMAEAPAVAWGAMGTPGGEFLAVWSEDTIIYGRRIQADNSLPGGLITVSNHPTCTKSDPAVVFAPGSSAWWTAWADNRESG
jgi:hypothetical protein